MHIFLFLKKGLKPNINAFQMSSLLPLKNFKNKKKNELKIKSSKRRFHNLAKIEDLMKSQTNVK